MIRGNKMKPLMMDGVVRKSYKEPRVANSSTAFTVSRNNAGDAHRRFTQSNQPLDSTGNSTTNTKKNTSNDCIGHFWLDQLQHIPRLESINRLTPRSHPNP
ncbi:hypothetical protein Bca4012_080756 [Brassica carinata]